MATTPAGYRTTIESTFGDQAAEVLARYPLPQDGTSPSVALATVLTDAEWSCPAVDTWRALSRYLPTWGYELADEHAPPLLGLQASFPLGASHAAELQYLFVSETFPDRLDPAQRQLSQQMVRYWLRFADAGNPNGAGSPDWPRYRPSRGYVQSLAPGDGGIGPVDVGREHQCDFWAALAAARR